MRDRRHAIVLALFAVLATPLAASAGSGQAGFGVGLRVLDGEARGDVLPSLPVPDGSQVLALDPARGSWVNAGDPAAIARFYEARMPALGFRLAARQDDATGARLAWEDARGTRVELRIRRMLGQGEGSWILATTA